MTPYRSPHLPRSTVRRARAQTGALIAAVVILSLACAGLVLTATVGGMSDPFLPGLGALLTGCSALGLLFGRVLGGSGSAPCPVCRAKIHDVERRGRVDGILCARCGRFLESVDGEVRPVDDDRVAHVPLFGAVLPEHFAWPPGCVVCGAPVTQSLPARTTRVDEATVGLNIVGLAMAATVGVGFAARCGSVAVDVPHCGEHDDGAVLAAGGPTGFLVFFRSLRYQREFCALNQAPACESPENGRQGRDPSEPRAVGSARGAHRR
jgi:hypothetical protein